MAAFSLPAPLRSYKSNLPLLRRIRSISHLILTRRICHLLGTHTTENIELFRKEEICVALPDRSSCRLRCWWPVHINLCLSQSRQWYCYLVSWNSRHKKQKAGATERRGMRRSSGLLVGDACLQLLCSHQFQSTSVNAMPIAPLPTTK